jgi:hypothetical protein
MKAFKTLALAAPILVLQACASGPKIVPPAAVSSLETKVCDKEISLKDVIYLTPEKRQAYHTVSTLIEAKTACLEKDGTKSNYVIYRLPANAENHTVTVGGVQEELRTFAPSVSLLDADAKPSRRFADDRFATLGNIIGIQFRPLPVERYILVQSNPALVGTSISSLATRISQTSGYTPATAYSYGGSYNIQSGVEVKNMRTYSHEGYVNVIVQAATGKIGAPEEKKP